MPSRSFEIVAYQNGTTDFQTIIYERDGSTAVILAVTDAVRFKVARGTGTPALDLVSGTVGANGSTVTIDDTNPATVTVRLAQADLAALHPGVYDAVLGVVDDSESAPADAFKPAEIGVVHVVQMPGGSLGL